MYQPDIYNTAYTNHYPNSYPVTTIPAPISYFPPLQTQQPAKIEPVQHDPPEPAVTHKVASKAIERLVLQELKNVGFDRVEQPAVGRLQLEVTTCVVFLTLLKNHLLIHLFLYFVVVQQLFQRAHEYANLANRARAIASDVLLACEDFDLTPRELNKVNKVTAKRKKGMHCVHRSSLYLNASLGRKGGSRTCPIELVKTKSRSPSPELLPSDDEEPSTAATVATTLTNLPVGFPKLPPKHTYLQTPVRLARLLSYSFFC